MKKDLPVYVKLGNYPAAHVGTIVYTEDTTHLSAQIDLAKALEDTAAEIRRQALEDNA